MSGKRLSRAEDERLLDWLACRTAGQTARQIGGRYGVTQEAVRVATVRVRDADIAESGEPREIVEGGYW